MADNKKAKKTDKSKKNPFKSIASFFKGVNSEGKKVAWPKAKEVLKNTLIVIVVIAIVSAVIYVIDLGLTSGMKGIKKLAENTTAAVEETTAQTTDEALTELVTETEETTTAE